LAGVRTAPWPGCATVLSKGYYFAFIRETRRGLHAPHHARPQAKPLHAPHHARPACPVTKLSRPVCKMGDVA
jgi:hypothetical protein